MARRGYGRYAAYPGAAVAGIFTNTVFGFMRAFILLALYQQRETVGGYDASAAVTYVWVGQALLMTVFMWGWLDIAVRIRTGAIARATPFPSIVQTPIDIFVGAVSGPAIVGALVTQIAWAIALGLAARWTFDLGVRRLVVQGG